MKTKVDLKERLRVDPKELELTPLAEKYIDRDPAAAASYRGIIAQERALKAMHLGINIEGPGYNIYVCGESGTGRTSTAMDLLEKNRRARRALLDRAFVMNFKDPDRPRLLEFPAGTVSKFRSDMESLIETLRNKGPRIFEATAYAKQKEKLNRQYERRQRVKVQAFEDLIKKDGLALAQVKDGQTATRPEVMPIVRGKVMSMSDVQELVDKGRFNAARFKKMQETHEAWKSKLGELLKELRREGREFEEKFKTLDRETFKEVISELVGEVEERYVKLAATVPLEKEFRGRPGRTSEQKCREYFSELKGDLLENIDAFREDGMPPEGEQLLERHERPEDPFVDYRVNVVLDNSGREQCPIVQEMFPSFGNLFGAIERPLEEQGAPAHFTSIKGGSILQADGGFLVLSALDVFTEPGVWRTLKRTLKHRRLEIQNMDFPGYSPPTTLKPEPIPIDVKVIMIGDENLYRMLHFVEEDFRKIFKVKSEFDTEMPISIANVSKYLSFISRACKEEGIPQLTPEAVTAVVEYGIRLVGDRKKISTQFSSVADLLREAAYFSRMAGRTEVTRDDAENAVKDRRHRFALDEDKLQEFFERGQILVDVSGEAVGQVNGLTVFDEGDHQFGRPVRITASVAVGKSGVINIERRAGLSGELYDKGLLILTGFLMGRFGTKMPINLRASLTLEQSYGGVDGDSASSAEVYVLLSALTGVPLDQSIAVTGSVNQLGEVQPVGGVSFKIEGFYDVCKARGLTNHQGVIVPRTNLDQIVLRPEVEAAIAQGKFHVWSVSTIDEGIEILTGVAAGTRRADGCYPEKTINRLVENRLAEMNRLLKNSGPKKGSRALPSSVDGRTPEEEG